MFDFELGVCTGGRLLWVFCGGFLLRRGEGLRYVVSTSSGCHLRVITRRNNARRARKTHPVDDRKGPLVTPGPSSPSVTLHLSTTKLWGHVSDAVLKRWGEIAPPPSP